MNVLTYEQLKARLDAVVAECAAQREALNAKAYIEWIKTNGWDAGAVTINGKFQHFMDSEVDFGSMVFGYARKLIMAVETPNVTAALAEVEAKAIEKALSVMSGFTSDECGDSVYIAVKELAKHLREGRA
ncbi:hypothetical protein [Serratia fonticola]